MFKNNKKFPEKIKKFQVAKKGKGELRDTAFSHPDPNVQRKCFAVLLLSFLFSASLVALILGLSATSVRNYWKLYQKEGVSALKKSNYKGQPSKLHKHKHSIEEDFEKNPPASIAEAIDRIEKLTGIKRTARSIRDFLKNLKFRYRKVGAIPAKANPEEQELFLKTKLEPRL